MSQVNYCPMKHAVLLCVIFAVASLAANAKDKPEPCGWGKVLGSREFALCPLTGVVRASGVAQGTPTLETLSLTSLLGPIAVGSSTTYVVQHGVRWWLVETDREYWLIWKQLGPTVFKRDNPPDIQQGNRVRLSTLHHRDGVNLQTDADDWHGKYVVGVQWRRLRPVMPQAQPVTASAVDCGPDSTELCAPPGAKPQPVDCSLELTFSTEGPASGCDLPGK